MGPRTSSSDSPAPGEAQHPALPMALRKRVAYRLLPYLFFLYIIAFLDRVNVSYAALGLSHDLHFSPEQIGFGLGIFFWGYFLLEVPSTVIVERWSARKWICRIMVSWGAIAVATGFIQTPRYFYLFRFLLGAGEAGFFPGLIVYLGHWFTERDRGKAVAIFMTANPVSFIVGSKISSFILQVHWLGLQSWRWIFILEGFPAIVFGLVNLAVLTDWPREAKWLPAEDRSRLQTAIDDERRDKPSHLRWFTYLTNRPVLVLTGIYFLSTSGSYGFGLWLPTMLKQASGYSDVRVTELAALPYVVALISMLAFGYSSDRTGERRWHTAIPLMITGSGFAALVLAHSLPATLLAFSIIGGGAYSLMAGFWALPPQYLTGTAVAVSVGLINSFGNLGGFFGPDLMGIVRGHSQSFRAAIAVLAVLQFIAAAMVFLLREPQTKQS
jgi:ACS family tartrate transporter-like MFS transporter